MSEITTDPKRVADLFGRYTQSVFPSDEKAKELFCSGARLKFYFGIDPTGPHIHLGHSTNLLWLKQFISLGHEAVLVIGDFTARIGDPSDKLASRTALSEHEVAENMATYIAQVEKILPKNSFTVAYNSEWLDKMTFGEVMSIASHVTVQQMIARDMFQERLKNEKPIYLHEFFYPLMQGYDSVALRVDGELCGNDQTFNSLMGRNLEKELLGKEKLVITTRLLEDGATGKKIMNKSEGTAIFMDDTPQEIRRKVLALNDGVIATVFRLCTEVSMGWIAQREQEILRDDNPKNFKEELASELVRMYHGQEAADSASGDTEIQGKGTLLQTICSIGIAISTGEAKKLIQQGAVSVNGKVVDRWDIPVKDGDEIAVGKGRRYRIK